MTAAKATLTNQTAAVKYNYGESSGGVLSRRKRICRWREINLTYCTIHSPISGIIGLQAGQCGQPGRQE